MITILGEVHGRAPFGGVCPSACRIAAGAATAVSSRRGQRSGTIGMCESPAERRPRILAAGIALGCAGCGQPAARPGAASCWQSAVRAIQRHVIIRSVPPSCAGLTGAELGVVVAWAVRAAGGAHAKAAQRRVAAADSRYLASLVRASASLAAAATATAGPGGRAAAAGSGRAAAALAPGASPGGQDGLGLAALGCWAVTAAVGGYLFRSHRRPAGLARRPPAIAAGHAGVALAGLAVWTAAAVAPGSAALAWSAAALVIGAAGLGLAVLLTAAPDSAPAAPRPARPACPAGPGARRVLAVASHVGLAVATMLLVLLAATGRS